MRWRLAKKLLSGKTIRVESNKQIKLFQVKKYAKLINWSMKSVEKWCWRTWIPLNKRNKPLPPKPILNDGFDGQPEIIAKYFQ